ncbi:MAG: steroid delta-isomerase, partial [Rhodococcus sp.]|nr:steroid delta-isomerase [Rhodococcus sp. (in: high G+C Gram-positive bacteria)]
MAPSAEVIRKTVDAYIETVATGTAAQVVALYAEGATVEDPVGTDVRTTR